MTNEDKKMDAEPTEVQLDERIQVSVEIINAPEEETPQTVVFACPIDHAGTSVYVKGWVVPHATKPPLIMVHDVGEDIGRFRRVARLFGEAGYSVYGFDLRGHGRSGRMLGHIQRFDSLVNDLLQVVAWIRHKSDYRLPVIVGQGLGALIAIYFQRRFPQYCQGLVLSSPTWQHKNSVSLTKRFIIKTIAEMAPTLRLPRRLTPYFLQLHPDYKRDLQSGAVPAPRYYGITANFVAEIMDALAGVEEKFRTLDCPTALLTAEESYLNNQPEFREILAKHKAKDKIKVIPLVGVTAHLLSGSDDEIMLAAVTILRWLEEDLPNFPGPRGAKLVSGLFDQPPKDT